MGLPFWSLAGVNLTLRFAIRQVASSRSEFPLEEVTLQAETRPSVPTDSAATTRPDASARIAAGG